MTEQPDTDPIELAERLDAALAASAGATTDARYQCGRLRHALSHAHAEGARFAAFTLGRLLAKPDTGVDEAVHQAYAALRTALISAGHKL